MKKPIFYLNKPEKAFQWIFEALLTLLLSPIIIIWVIIAGTRYLFRKHPKLPDDNELFMQQL